MKKISLLTVLLSSVFHLHAQFTTGTTPPYIRVTSTSSKMGIGNYPSLSNPIDFLTVGGNISLYPTTDASTRGINGRTNTGILL